MFEEIEILRSRTDELLVQVLSQWGQSIIVHQDSQLPPFCGLACSLSGAHDMLAQAAEAAAVFEAAEDIEACPDGEQSAHETQMSYDIEKREVKTTSSTRKGGRK